MADAIISAVLQQLASLVDLQVQQEVKLVVGVDEEVKRLTTNFQIVQAVLADAERRQVTERAVRVWLEQLKYVSYDMDDVLDTWNTAIMKRLQTEGSNHAHTLMTKVCSSCLFPYKGVRQVVLHHDVAFKIRAINERLDAIVELKDTFNFKICTGIEQPQRVKSTSFVDESNVFGRDEENNTLLSKLLSESSVGPKNLHIISIVGMGGIGKTTLAQWAYNNDKVMSNFEKRMWVCVSDPFDELRIAKAINEALGGDNSKLIELESVFQEIRKSIVGKKFLLILDDVWTEDFNKWEPFYCCLKNGLHGSKVVVTTRKQTTALMMESSDTITIQELSNEQCWLLFRQFAFFGRTNEECEALEQIGREIVSKCKGLPLAAKAIGSLLRFKKTRKEWENILYNEMWKLDEFEKGVVPPLLLSFYDLPPMVKQCFTYCAMFPKDFEFEKDELIRLWMAQGYLGLDQNEEIEIVGEECFNTLAMRSFFQEFEKDDDDSIIRCKMHDIVHDVAQFLSKKECCMVEAKDLEEPNKYALCEKAHHLMVEITDIVKRRDTLPISICNFKSLRSLMIDSVHFSAHWSIGSVDFDPHWSIEVTPKLFEKLTSLKALQIRCVNISKKIGKLFHLRYLDLSYCRLRKLAESLCELYNLQTLKLVGCESLKALPQGMGKLVNLRHLMNRYTDSLRYMPKGIERLIKLRTLTEFHLSGGDYSGKACSLECLLNFRHIEYLGITGFKNSRQVIDEFGQLKNNINIRELQLGFSEKDSTNDAEAILEAFHPPPNLQRLTIRAYAGQSMSSLSRMMSLINLRSISLTDCTQCLRLPPMGKLSSLETLCILYMPRVRGVGNEFVGVERDDASSSSSSSSIISFPKLKTLRFVSMSNWEVWDFGSEDDTTIIFMSSLHTLELYFATSL